MAFMLRSITQHRAPCSSLCCSCRGSAAVRKVPHLPCERCVKGACVYLLSRCCAACGIAVVQEPLHSRLSMEGGNIPIAAALHPDSPAGNLRKASAALMSEPDVDSCKMLEACHVKARRMPTELAARL